MVGGQTTCMAATCMYVHVPASLHGMLVAWEMVKEKPITAGVLWSPNPIEFNVCVQD